MAKKVKTVKAWAGIVNGKVHSSVEYYWGVPVYSLFKTRGDAKSCFEEISLVEIRSINKPERRMK